MRQQAKGKEPITDLAIHGYFEPILLIGAFFVLDSIPSSRS